MTMLDSYARELDALADARLRRTRRNVQAMHGARLRVDGQEMLAFCSNDYLGLAQHPALIEAAQAAAAQWGTGATASPLVCGHSASHEALEQELAQFLGLPRALYFHAGYAANIGLIPALVGRGDALFCDALNHACLIDGARLSRADIHVYPHADLAALERQLGDCDAPRKLIATDAVFSMDGAIAPLPELLRLAERHDALLLIDDAHGFGVLGPGGRGTAAHFDLRSPRLVVMGTLSKAAGAAGGFVAGDATIVELVLQRARSYIFATAAPAMVTEALRASLRLIEAEDWRRDRLRAHAARLREALAHQAIGRLMPSSTPIQPLVVGENGTALALMARLWDRGLWVPAIRPPTVPAGTARLRISLSAAHDENDVERLIEALNGIAPEAR
jgi:8-amino-7-oxononanoate synthase